MAGLTWGLGGWAGVMFSLRMGIGGRNLVGGGLRNEFFASLRKYWSQARMCAHSNGPRGHGERSETLFSPEAADRASIAM